MPYSRGRSARRRRSENQALQPCQGGGREFESRRPLHRGLQVRRYDDSPGPDAEPSACRNRATPSRTDPAVLKVLLKVKPGAAGGYD